MVKLLLKKSYRHKDLKEIKFKDLWNSQGVFTTMRVLGKPPKILFFKKHIDNLFRSLKVYKINKKHKNKIKKQENLNLNLEKNVDILNYVSNHNSMRPKLVIGFAAETNEINKNAEEKLDKKNCDWIISNDVSNKDIGFNSDYNEVTIHYKNKNVKKEKLSYKKKSGISDEIVDRIIDQLN